METWCITVRGWYHSSSQVSDVSGNYNFIMIHDHAQEFPENIGEPKTDLQMSFNQHFITENFGNTK